MRISDWSSDVCSSDLSIAEGVDGNILPAALGQLILGNVTALERAQQFEAGQARNVIGENTAGGHEQSDPTSPGVPNRPLQLPRTAVTLRDSLHCRSGERRVGKGSDSTHESRGSAGKSKKQNIK